MTIHIEDLKFQCIIGILDFERTKPQDVIVNVEIKYDYKEGFVIFINIFSIESYSLVKFKFIDSIASSISRKSLFFIRFFISSATSA